MCVGTLCLSIRAREAKFELDFQPDKKALKATSSFGIATTGDCMTC